MANRSKTPDTRSTNLFSFKSTRRTGPPFSKDQSSVTVHPASTLTIFTPQPSNANGKLLRLHRIQLHQLAQRLVALRFLPCHKSSRLPPGDRSILPEAFDLRLLNFITPTQ
jgi:hypothetical protein